MNDQIIDNYLQTQEDDICEYSLPLPEELWEGIIAEFNKLETRDRQIMIERNIPAFAVDPVDTRNRIRAALRDEQKTIFDRQLEILDILEPVGLDIVGGKLQLKEGTSEVNK